MANEKEIVEKIITCAAIRHSSGLIYSLPKPKRHHHIIHLISNYDSELFEQGFLNTKGEFLTRLEALDELSKDTLFPTIAKGLLTSEDLW